MHSFFVYKEYIKLLYVCLAMRYVFIILFVVFQFASSAQKATISGYIEDAANGEKLIGATIYEANTMQATTSNVYGFYSLTLDTGKVDLRVSYVGYASSLNNLTLSKDIFQTVQLSTDNELQEVVISEATTEKIHQKNQMSTVKLEMKQIEKLPAFMGEVDVLKTIQLLPGVQSGGEGNGGLYIRGGGPDQNLIMLDGVPVYNAYHLFGFFSVFNSSAISTAEVMTGGFPARYGGRASSVIDIRMKEGNQMKYSGEASIGLISSKFMLEGPLWKNKTSFLVSGRRTYIDFLARPLIASFANRNGAKGSTGGYYFYDFNAKLNHKFSEKSRLFISAYTGDDKVYLTANESSSVENTEAKMDFDLDWGNIISAVRFNQIINKKLFANFTGTYSRYRSTNDLSYETSEFLEDTTIESSFGIGYLSGIDDYGGKITFDYLPNPNHTVKFGGGNTYHKFTPGVNSFNLSLGDVVIDTTIGADFVNANEMHFFVEDEMKIWGRLKGNAGIHFSTFSVNDSTYRNLQPRLSLSYVIRENLTVKASFSRMAQYIHLLTNGTVGFPTDLWVPVTDTIPPINSDQVALGLAYTYDDKYEFSVEGYYKTMDNLIEYKDGATFFGNAEGWQSKVEIGEGWSYGAEFLAKKNSGRTTGWIGYTLAWTNRQFTELNQGRIYPYTYDRRNDVSVALVHKITEVKEDKFGIDLGVTWVYGTGRAISLPNSTYRAYDTNIYQEFKGLYAFEIDNYAEKNGYREPAYHRLDASVTMTKNTKRVTKIWTFGVYNMYNRKNPFMVQLGYNNQGLRVLKQYSLFPLIPSVAFSLKF